MSSCVDVNVGAKITCVCGVTFATPFGPAQRDAGAMQRGLALLLPWLTEHHRHGELEVVFKAVAPSLDFDVTKTDEWPTLVSSVQQGIIDNGLAPDPAGDDPPWEAAIMALDEHRNGEPASRYTLTNDDGSVGAVVVVARGDHEKMCLNGWFDKHQGEDDGGGGEGDVPAEVVQ